MKEQTNSTSEININALEEQYKELMEKASGNSISSTWEKEGDIYKLFNLHDASKYETMLSSNTPITNN